MSKTFFMKKTKYQKKKKKRKSIGPEFSKISRYQKIVFNFYINSYIVKMLCVNCSVNILNIIEICYSSNFIFHVDLFFILY